MIQSIWLFKTQGASLDHPGMLFGFSGTSVQLRRNPHAPKAHIGQLIAVQQSRVAPAPIFCDELHELMDRFRHVAHEYLEIQSAHLAAIAKGKGGFKKQIEVARRRKEDAKCAILEHQERHGCRS